jgi:hypothetical protein
LSATVENSVVCYQLQKKSQSLRLIEILENFTNENSSKDEVESEDDELR